MAQHKGISPANFKDILRKLTACAVGLFATAGLSGPEAVMKGIGKSPEDLAMDTILLLTGGELKYHSARGPVIPFLAKVMKRDFLDLLRRKSYRTTEILPRVAEPSENDSQPQEGGISIGLEDLAGSSNTFEVVSAVEFRERVLSLVKGEQDLEDLVVAVLDLNLKKPQEIADILQTDTKDILNRRRRLRWRTAEFFGRRKR